MTQWMLQMQENDKKLVEMANEHTESETYAGNVREMIIYYLKNNGGDSPDAE
jgi:hypothetical protein